MIRKLVLAASAVALVGGSMFAAVGGSAGASVTITAGSGSTLSCTNLKATVKVSPPLMDDYLKADHQDTNSAHTNTYEPNPDVRALNNVNFAADADALSVNGKGTSKACGTSKAKQGSVQSLLKSVTVTIAQTHAGTDQADCIGLVNGALGVGDPSTARYKVTIKYVQAAGQPAKVEGTTITNAQIDNSHTSFTVHPSGTSVITGSYAFAGSNLVIAASPDLKTAGYFATEVLGPSPEGTTVARSLANKGKSPGPCQPGLKIKGDPINKPTKPHSASVVAPKGIKAIGTAFDGAECSNSTLTISSPCTP